MIGLQSSIAGNYELVWRGDPALDSEAADFEQRWSQACDGLLPWQSVCKPGAVPTVFVMRAIPGSKFRRLVRVLDGTDKGAADDCALMFRLSLVEIKNETSVRVAHKNHPEVGLPMATDEVVDWLDDKDKSIVTELGTLAFQRMTLPPKP